MNEKKKLEDNIDQYKTLFYTTFAIFTFIILILVAILIKKVMCKSSKKSKFVDYDNMHQNGTDETLYTPRISKLTTETFVSKNVNGSCNYNEARKSENYYVPAVDIASPFKASLNGDVSKPIHKGDYISNRNDDIKLNEKLLIDIDHSDSSTTPKHYVNTNTLKRGLNKYCYYPIETNIKSSFNT